MVVNPALPEVAARGSKEPGCRLMTLYLITATADEKRCVLDLVINRNTFGKVPVRHLPSAEEHNNNLDNDC